MVLTTDGHIWTWGQPWPPGDMYYFSFFPLSVFGVSNFCFSGSLYFFIVFSVNKYQLQLKFKVLSECV